MKNLSLAPPITCQRCKAIVFPHIREGMFLARCSECGWNYVDDDFKSAVRLLQSVEKAMSAANRFNQLCDEIEKQGKSGQLLEILRQNFSDFLVYVESEEMKRCDALAIGVNTLATLAVLKHI